MHRLPPARYGPRPPNAPRFDQILRLYGLLGLGAIVVLGLTYPLYTLLVVAGAVIGVGLLVGIVAIRGVACLCLPRTSVCLDVSLAGPQRASERL